MTTPVRRRLRRRLKPSVRGGGEALVCIYAGATTGVIGILQGMPQHSNLARERRS
ncbi:unnamed protein product [Ectocarpus sp. 6 AP-2014]